MKTHNQKQIGEKRMYFILQVSSHNPSLREVKEELSRELKQSLQKNTANWLAPLIAPTATNLGVALPTLSWALPYQSSSET